MSDTFSKSFSASYLYYLFCESDRRVQEIVCPLPLSRALSSIVKCNKNFINFSRRYTYTDVSLGKIVIERDTLSVIRISTLEIILMGISLYCKNLNSVLSSNSSFEVSI